MRILERFPAKWKRFAVRKRDYAKESRASSDSNESELALGTPLRDYGLGLAAMVAAGVYLAAAYGYAPEARAAPLLIGWAVVALAGLDLASRTSTAAGRALTAWLNPVAGRRPMAAQHERIAYAPARQLVAILWIAGFVAALALIGTLYAIPLYVFAATRWRGQRPLGMCLMSAAGTLGGVWLLFSRLLRLELYPGLLPENVAMIVAAVAALLLLAAEVRGIARKPAPPVA